MSVGLDAMTNAGRARARGVAGDPPFEIPDGLRPAGQFPMIALCLLLFGACAGTPLVRKREGQLIYRLIGTAVTIAGLFVASAGPVGIEAMSYWDADVSGAAGPDIFGGTESGSARSSQSATQTVDARAEYTVASLIASDSPLANYLSKLSPNLSGSANSSLKIENNSRMRVYSDSLVTAAEASSKTPDGTSAKESSNGEFAEDNSKSSVPIPIPRPLARDPVPANSPRAQVASVPSKPTLHPAGCAQCSPQVALATSDPANSFPAILTRNTSRNTRSVRDQGTTAGTGRDREAPLVTAWTFTRG